MVTCQVCNGAGWIEVPQEPPYRPAMKRCECVNDAIRLARIERATRGCRVATTYEDGKTFDVFKGGQYEPQAVTVKAWSVKPDHWLFITGTVGTGKTHLAAAAINALRSTKTYAVGFVSVPDMLDALRPNGGQPEASIDDLQRLDVLAMDDLGAEKPTEWTAEVFFRLIDYRYMNKLPTLITSNLSLKQLAERQGWLRIVDRIGEMSKQVNMTGESYRRTIAKGMNG